MAKSTKKVIRKKKIPNYMKPLTSKEPVPTIKRSKGFVVEPFEI